MIRCQTISFILLDDRYMCSRMPPVLCPANPDSVGPSGLPALCPHLKETDSLCPDLKNLSRRQARAIIRLSSFVSHLSEITVVCSRYPVSWKLLFIYFIQLFSCPRRGGGWDKSSLCYSILAKVKSEAYIPFLFISTLVLRPPL